LISFDTTNHLVPLEISTIILKFDEADSAIFLKKKNSTLKLSNNLTNNLRSHRRLLLKAIKELLKVIN